MYLVVLSPAGSGDSGAQDSWKGHGEMMAMRKGKRKNTGALNRASARLQQPRARILRARGQEVIDDGETSALESESSDQGELVNNLIFPEFLHNQASHNASQTSANQSAKLAKHGHAQHSG